MSNQYLNPDDLFDARPFGFSQAVVCPANGTAYLSGQTAWDKSGKLSSGADYAAQAVGAKATDVVRVRVYIVNHTPDKLGVLGKAMADCFGADALPASTVIGVAALALPELLVEIEADVSLPPARLAGSASPGESPAPRSASGRRAMTARLPLAVATNREVGLVREGSGQRNRVTVVGRRHMPRLLAATRPHEWVDARDSPSVRSGCLPNCRWPGGLRSTWQEE